jgi:hypothetical protein
MGLKGWDWHTPGPFSSPCIVNYQLWDFLPFFFVTWRHRAGVCQKALRPQLRFWFLILPRIR